MLTHLAEKINDKIPLFFNTISYYVQITDVEFVKQSTATVKQREKCCPICGSIRLIQRKCYDKGAALCLIVLDVNTSGTTVNNLFNKRQA